MPFTIQNLKLPFLKVSSSAKTGRKLVWHVGPWQYNTRTGRHTLKLSRTVRYESRTRTEKATARRKRAERRAHERATWSAYFAGQAPPPAPTRAKKKTATKRAASPTITHQRVTPASAAPTGPTAQVSMASGAGTFGEWFAEGMCRRRTADGGICEQPASKCPPGTHAAGSERASVKAVRQVQEQRWANEAAQARARLRADGWEVPDEPVAVAEPDHENAGMCAQKTQDGTPCQRLGTCPPGTHHPRRTSNRKKATRR